MPYIHLLFKRPWLLAWSLESQQWWPDHCPSAPGPQPPSSLLNHSQQEALSAVSPILRTAALHSLPATPSLVSTNHTDSARNLLHPTSTGNSYACQPFSQHSMMRSWYFRLFLSWTSSQPSSHGTVNSTRMTFFACSDQITLSGLRVVWTMGGK